jgi:hypothetical protein
MAARVRFVGAFGAGNAGRRDESGDSVSQRDAASSDTPPEETCVRILDGVSGLDTILCGSPLAALPVVA